MLVVPADQLRSYLQRPGCGLNLIHRLFDGPARDTLTHFDRPTGLLGGNRRRPVPISLLFHLDQELAEHIAAKEFVIRGAA